MSNYAKNLSTVMNKKISQSEAIPGREQEMVKNNAGGFSFKVSPWDQLDRFLILGSEGGTYYVSERKLTRENATNIVKLIDTDGIRVVKRVVEISESGRASKNDPALFVLALASAASDVKVRTAALEALPKVARIGTHLFHYVSFVEGFRGWGRALKRAIGNWYLNMPADKLAYQAIKYQQRDGWSHRDLLRLSHPKTTDASQDSIFKWIVDGFDNMNGKEEFLDSRIKAFEEAKSVSTVSEIVGLITQYDLPREAIPTHFLNNKEVWEALLVRMPLTAMIRNLATMTRVGLLSSYSDAKKLVISRLNDRDYILRSRVHPMMLLSAHNTYNSGYSVRGNNTWQPVSKITDALNDAFYLSFGNVVPTGKNTLLALDVSGSMCSPVSGDPSLSAREASAALALITAAVEPNYEIIGFTGSTGRYSYKSSVSVLKISPKMRLSDVVSYISRLNFSSTDCSLPILWAKQNKHPVESFAVYTDNETWAGDIHPSQAVKDYRNTTGIPAKIAVVGMASNGFTIADPTDSGMLDVVGFDPATPQIISDFFR